MAKVAHWLSIVVVAAVINAAVWGLAILWFEPHPIASYSRSAWPETVRPGGVVTITASAVRTKDGCPSIIHRKWIDAGGVVIETSQQPAPPKDSGPEGQLQFRVKVPQSAPPGPLVLRTAVEFRCNVVQRWLGGSWLHLNDIHFTVTP